GALSFLIYYFDTRAMHGNRKLPLNLFSYVQPMSVGFVFFAAARMMKAGIKYFATASIMIGSLIATLFINSPWVFPALLLVSGTISNFSNNRIPQPLEKPKKINWMHLWLFVVIYLVAIILSELSLRQHWPNGRI